MLSSGLGRQPREEMTARHAVAIIELLDTARIDAWLDGGWAVDVVLGAQRRPHDDLDLIVQLADADRLSEILAKFGFEHAAGGAPKSFELVDSRGRQVDVHPVVFADSGDGLYLMENGEHWIYPARGFAGTGRLADRLVRCLTPDVQMLCHAGYEPHRSSYDDVWALSERFGLPVPKEYQAERETYPMRV